MSQEALKIQLESIGARVDFRWLGLRRSLTAEQKEEAAETFAANPTFMSASKRIFNPKSPPFAKLARLKREIIAAWKGMTLPFPEDSTRLLHKDEVGAFNDLMKKFEERFWPAVEELDEQLPQLKAEVKAELGSLFDGRDYPDSVKSHFDFRWSFPPLEPPDYLLKVAPGVYQQEKERLGRLCAESVNLVRQEFVAKFQEMVAGLADKLKPNADGAKKTIQKQSINALLETLYAFQQVNVGNSAELEALIAKTKELVDGRTDELKQSAKVRQEVAGGLAKVQQCLESMIVTAPRRLIAKPEDQLGK